MQRFKILQIVSKRLLVTVGQATSIGNAKLAARTIQFIGTITMNRVDGVPQQVPGYHAELHFGKNDFVHSVHQTATEALNPGLAVRQ